MDRLLEAESSIYPDPWTRGMFLEELSRPAAPNWLAEIGDGSLVGYVIGIEQHDELHIGNIAVLMPFRRRGIASRLLRKCIDWARGRGVRDLWLEVRESNAAAVTLYERTGFRIVGRRPGYYRADDQGSREDALVLRFPLAEDEGDVK